MNRSETITELAKALSACQGDLANPPKNAQNPHFRNTYADLASIRDTIRVPLSKHGLSVVQATEFVDGRVIVETMLMHVSGEYISTSLAMPVAKHDAQAIGSASTYGRRYALQSLLCIAGEEEDDGNTASAPSPVRPAAPVGKPACPQDRLQKGIESGRSGAELKALLSSKYTLTTEQIALLDAFEGDAK